MKKAFICKYCGRSFVPKYKVQKSSIPKYCSKECYHKSTKSGKTRTCKYCNKEFYIYRSRIQQEFCSIECRKKSRMTTKQCGVCGKIFEVYKSISDRYKVCSIECKLKYVLRKKCLRCGKEFTVRRKGSRYCSEMCRRPPVYINCLNCKKKFRVVPSSKEWKRFCSFSCYRKYSGESGLEKKLRTILMNGDIDFVQEFQIGTYCIDFFLPNHDLCVEADGKYWHSSEYAKKADAKKDDFLESNGFKVLRLKEEDILLSKPLLRSE